MYYRVAIHVEAQPPWKWQSTVLSSLNTLFQWLQVYRAFPHERLHIFSSSSREDLNEQLMRENQGLGSTSVPAAQFLQERMIRPPEATRSTSKREGGASQQLVSIAVAAQLSSSESDGEARPLAEKGVSFLEQRRGELERGAGGDHECPYRFTLPGSMPQVLTWVKLLVRVQQADLQP